MLNKRLGKNAARHDSRNLCLAAYLKPSLPQAPASIQWGAQVDEWHMFRNDELGDCTCASAGHMIRCWTANSLHKQAEILDDDVLKMYSGITGYAPDKPERDTGAVELDVLKYWRAKGCGGHKIGAFLAVSSKNRTLVRDGIYLFGGMYLGLELPSSAQSQKVWEVPVGGARG